MAALSLNHQELGQSNAHRHTDGERQKLPAVPATSLQLPRTEESPSNSSIQAAPQARDGGERIKVPVSAATPCDAPPSRCQQAAHTGKVRGSEVEEMIWRMTSEYLRKLQSVCCSPGCPSAPELALRITQRFAAEDTQQSGMVSLVAEALGTAPPPVGRIFEQRTGPAHSELSRCSQVDSDLGKSAKCQCADTADRKAEFCCFLCPAVFPFKKNLVRHFQKDHGISRSQSLLFKRLKQGTEHFKRLYIDPRSK